MVMVNQLTGYKEKINRDKVLQNKSKTITLHKQNNFYLKKAIFEFWVVYICTKPMNLYMLTR